MVRGLRHPLRLRGPRRDALNGYASFTPRSKKHASLLFHTGASIPGDWPHLTGTGEVARTMAIPDLQSVEALRGELTGIVHAWCRLKGG